MATLIQYMTRASAFGGEWKWQAAGMCYVIRTDGGDFIIIDGGHAADAEGLVSYLEKICGGVPDVALWILTHPHGDHVGALHAIVSDFSLLQRVRIHSVCFSAPGKFTFGEGRTLERELLMLREILSFSGAEHIEPFSGDVLHVHGVRIDFLFTYRDAEVLSDPNELSLVFVAAANGKRIMFTGDSYHRSLDSLAGRLGGSLSCDFCQLAHHALNGGSIPFYSVVGAQAVLVPISRSGFEAMKGSKYDTANAPARFAIAAATDIYYAFCGTASIEL